MTTPPVSTVPNCLIVDDLSENLVALRGLLADLDVNVIAARSGEEALDLLLKHDFALALLDVQMPSMDGFELAEFMRGTEKTRAIPIIFVTAAGGEHQRIFKGYEAGAVDFLTKPLRPFIVVSKVKIFLDLYTQKLELQRALRSRDEFLSIASHELKTPLTSMKLQLQIFERRKEKFGEEAAYSPELMRKYLLTTSKSIERIIHLVDDMLDISKVAIGKLSLDLEAVNLPQLVEEVADRIQPFLELSNCALTLRLPKTAKVTADRFRIEQVLTNLLTNASKYAPGAAVEISMDATERSVVLRVSDKGPGISRENQAKIFDRFERLSSDSAVTGLGIGLYISKEIVHMHGGSLTVRSLEGEGATFIVELPKDKS